LRTTASPRVQSKRSVGLKSQSRGCDYHIPKMQGLPPRVRCRGALLLGCAIVGNIAPTKKDMPRTPLTIQLDAVMWVRTTRFNENPLPPRTTSASQTRKEQGDRAVRCLSQRLYMVSKTASKSTACTSKSGVRPDIDADGHQLHPVPCKVELKVCSPLLLVMAHVLLPPTGHFFSSIPTPCLPRETFPSSNSQSCFAQLALPPDAPKPSVSIPPAGLAHLITRR